MKIASRSTPEGLAGHDLSTTAVAFVVVTHLQKGDSNCQVLK